MSFESIQFAVFLPIVFALFWACRPKYRWIVILAANIIYYAFAGAEYLFILLYVCGISFIFSKVSRGCKKNKVVLICGIAAVISPLLFFKYITFFQYNLNCLLQATGSDTYFEPYNVLLPLGISFYTFSAIAYMIDCYRGKVGEKYSFLQLMTGISFFPSLTAGPIERQEHLLPQILGDHNFEYETAVYGLKRIAFGFFKKLVIADTLAACVNKVFLDVHSYHGFVLFAAAVFFAFEIYCDFSGYSDIAIGVARLFGIRLFENFASPFFSESFTELWRRWHISLTSWFKDYIYFPLGGSRKGKFRKAVNIMIVFLVSGLWHGANWTFVIWGGLNGAFQIAEMFLLKQRTNSKAIWRILNGIIVFTLFIIVAVFFRAGTVSDAFYILAQMFKGVFHPVIDIGGIVSALGLTYKKMLIIFGEIMILLWYDYTALKDDPIRRISEKPVIIRWTVYVVFTLLVIQLSVKGSLTEFIYAAF